MKKYVKKFTFVELCKILFGQKPLIIVKAHIVDNYTTDTMLVHAEEVFYCSPAQFSTNLQSPLQLSSVLYIMLTLWVFLSHLPTVCRVDYLIFSYRLYQSPVSSTVPFVLWCSHNEKLFFPCFLSYVIFLYVDSSTYMWDEVIYTK